MKRKFLVLPLAVLTAALSACTQENGPDTTSPTVTLNAVTSPVTTSGAVTVSAKASDDVGIKQVDFYLDDAATPFATDTSADAGQNYTATLNLSAAQNGTHTIRVVAVDTSGNTSTQATQNITVNIDNVPPVVTVTGLPTTTVTSAGTYTIGYSATDNVGVTSVRGVLTRQGTTTTLLDQTTTTTSGTLGSVSVDASLNGTYTLTVTATDAAGNVGTSIQTVVIDIPGTPLPNPGTTPTPDTEAPRVTITVPQSPITTAGNYDILISLSDNVRVTSVTGYVQSDALGRIDLTNLDPAGGKATIPVSRAFNGNNTIYITARDAAGNEGKAQASVQVNIP
ncbi:Ig-like domain-containing protein [Deinococcus antarcticus]|uniref:Ig-like domain-containing protein n=1 Tax=Deinococcus antarcticus TaxID=1298767 RepID=A0ABV8ACE1_9DEIO